MADASSCNCRRGETHLTCRSQARSLALPKIIQFFGSLVQAAAGGDPAPVTNTRFKWFARLLWRGGLSSLTTSRLRLTPCSYESWGECLPASGYSLAAFRWYEHFRQRRSARGKSLRDIQTRTGVFATPFPSPFWRLVGFVARLRWIATSDSSAGSKSWGWVGDVASVTLTKVGITLMD